MKALITGCGRSGTAFAAQWLTRRGLFAEHERDGRHAVSSWCLAACQRNGSRLSPISLPGWHGPIDWGADYTLVVHLVRNPLDVIASWRHTVTDERTWEWVDHVLGDGFGDDSPLVSAMRYWVEWNALAERISDVRVRLQDVRTDDKTTNSRPHPAVTTDELLHADRYLSKEVFAMAGVYGLEY